ncbi:hypothetical protein JT359_15805 [Candidatus Poribacteria bacterium]|nr:hypothetical protein [Candidatus Poribacteria bacterium]
MTIVKKIPKAPSSVIPFQIDYVAMFRRSGRGTKPDTYGKIKIPVSVSKIKPILRKDNNDNCSIRNGIISCPSRMASNFHLR